MSWRNAFAATTFVRILQKLVKNKPARIRTLLELRAQVRRLWMLSAGPQRLLTTTRP